MKGLFYHRFKGWLALLVVQTAKCKCFFKSNISVPNEIVTKFKAKYQHLLKFFEFVGVNATKYNGVVGNLTMKSFSSQNLSLRIENFAKIFIAIYCNMQ